MFNECQVTFIKYEMSTEKKVDELFNYVGMIIWNFVINPEWTKLVHHPVYIRNFK